MKKRIILLGIMFVLLAAAGYILSPRLFHGSIYLKYGQSGFSYYTNTNAMMYSRCYLTVVNETDRKAYVRISATAGLIDRHTIYAQKELTGYGQDLCTDIFPVEPGENELLVYFGAPYRRPDQMKSGKLPWNIRITPVAEADPGITAVAEEQYYGAEVLISSEDVEEGVLFAEYDFDRDGTLERLELCREENAELEAQGFRAPLQVLFYDEGVLSSQLEIPIWLEMLQDVLLYDFHFEDGSLEVILRFQYATETSIPNHEVSLVRVADGQIYMDTGSIFAPTSSDLEPMEVQGGQIYSISGNRVTLTGWSEPIRIDLEEKLN